ncbi:MFS transporter [Alteromonas sp. ASW11-36]|uniref:MFS transporter n=1 Tax=Alteromonas arenosi TaxID=3055817 RepID=A0ABT7SSH4_9ALTE|nr:MFS transporter [Alteromonas sp. ASW11-36]MDM7859153.1 MFS transporter [Alteromonas sp. ASW11-36]
MNAAEFRAAFSLAAVYMSRMLGLFMVMPVLAVAAVELDGFSPVWLGLAIGGYGLTQAVLQIPVGMLSDRFGRKPVIYVGLTVFAIGSVVAALAENMTGLVIGRVLQGMGAIAGSVMALAADTTRAEQRTKVMAIIGISIGMSFYVAVLIGPLLAGQWGLSGLFWVTAGLAIVSILLVIFVVPTPTAQHANPETLPQQHHLRFVLNHQPLLKLNVSVALLHMLITTLFILIPPQLIEAGFALGEHWQIYLPVLLLSIVFLGIIMRAAAKVKTGVSIQFCIFLMAIAIVGLAWLPLTVSSLLTLLVAFFAGFNYLEARMPALVSIFAPAGARGTAMGVYASCQFFGAFLGGLWSGLITSWHGTEAVYAVIITVTILWMGLFFRFNTHPSIKRVTLRIENAATSADQVRQTLTQIPGIVEINPALEQHLVYLRVDHRFDHQRAQDALAKNNN